MNSFALLFSFVCALFLTYDFYLLIHYAIAHKYSGPYCGLMPGTKTVQDTTTHHRDGEYSTPTKPIGPRVMGVCYNSLNTLPASAKMPKNNKNCCRFHENHLLFWVYRGTLEIQRAQLSIFGQTVSLTVLSLILTLTLTLKIDLH